MHDAITIERARLALSACGGNIRAASELLGGEVSCRTLRYWAAGNWPHERIGPRTFSRRRNHPIAARIKAVYLVTDGGMNPHQASKVVGVSDNCVYEWMRRYEEGGWAAVLDGARAGGAPGDGKAAPMEGAEHAYDGFEGTLEEKVRKLEVENAILREVNELLKGGSLSSLTNREKTLLVESLRRKTDIPLRELTDSLRISKSSYEYQRAAISRGDKYALLRRQVREIFEGPGRSSRGYRFVATRLRELPDPVIVSEKVVRRLMREEGLVPTWMRRKRRPWSSYAGEVSPAPGNLVGRDFRSALPNCLWLTDITEFRIPAGKVYLSAIRDCFDSSAIAWRIGAHPTADLANATLADACSELAPGEKPVIHSDRGGHYRWPGWIGICEEAGLVRSMSAKGCSPDNAAMEGFFGLLKKEFFHGRDWSGWEVREFMEALDAWLVDYNATRRSDALGGMTPREFRRTLGRAL